jgi:predicted dehydrogenase/GrpB-like predicted nucleotidyltransferase (UPF0157 family)
MGGIVTLDKVKIGAVGLGLVSAAHIKGYMSHPRAEVAAVCDSDETRARTVAKQFGIPRYYTSYLEMLTDAEINAIDIMTPTYLHRPMAVAAARAGKHIHCEKPLALTLAEGEEICDEADKHGVALAVDETYVFMGPIVKARALIEGGAIGKPQQIRQRFGAWLARPGALDAAHRGSTGTQEWRHDSTKAGGNGYPWEFDHNVHFFAMAQYLMDGAPVRQVYSLKPGTADGLSLMTWVHEGHAGVGVWTRAERLNGGYDFMTGLSATVIGDKGAIEFLGEGGGGLRCDGRPVHLVLHRNGHGPETFRFDDEGQDDIWESEVSYYSSAHVRRMHEFVGSLVEGRPSRYSGRDGLRDLRAAIASICSAREGLPVQVARPHNDQSGPEHLVQRPVVVAYDAQWPVRAARLIAELEGTLSPLARRVEHIGSTAVPGMAAKAVLDIQVSVDDLAAAAAYFGGHLQELGFAGWPYVKDHVPEGRTEGPEAWAKRFWSRRGHPDGDVNLHVRRVGSANERLALLFRDWFRAHPEAVPAYSAFKRSLAEVAADVGPYTEVKDPVVDLVSSVAEAWAPSVGWRA